MHEPSADKAGAEQNSKLLAEPKAGLNRVTFVAPFGLGQKTTVWARILPLAQCLSRRRITTSLIIPPWDSPAQAGLGWDDEGVAVENVRLSGGPAAILGRVVKRITRQQPDIIHIVKPVAYAGATQTLMWYLRKAGGGQSKIVLDTDDWEQDWATLNGRSRLVQRLVAWQENWGLAHADGVTVASQWLMQQVRRRNPAAPVCYLPNGVAKHAGETAPAMRERGYTPLTSDLTGASTLSTTPKTPNVLFFTRFIEIPPDWLVAFCATLFEQHATVVLLIAGSGIAPHLEERYKTEFQRLAAPANIDSGRIRWLGHVRIDALDTLYESTTCAIFPAQPTPLQQAKCSVRLATTLLHGVPVIASAVGEQKTYGRAGSVELAAADCSPRDFAQIVLGVLHAPDRLATRQQEARGRLLAEYNWETLGERLYRFYRVLVQS